MSLTVTDLFCGACGCAYEDETAGCSVCEMRHSKRRKAAA